MSDPDRGAYTPPSDQFSFHPRAPVRSGPAPVTLIASAVVLVAAIGAVYFVYKGGIRHRGEAPASVGTPIAAIKAPPPPALVNAAPARLVVERSDQSVPQAPPAFAPPPEAPRPLPPPAHPTAAAASAPVAAAPLRPTGPATPAPPPASTAAASQKPHEATTVAPREEPLTIAKLTDEALRTRQAPPAAVDGGPVVQIGAFSSAALAETGWGEVARLESGRMSAKGKRVETAQKDGRTFYRAFVTGFATLADAEAFCGDLKGAGHACFVK